MAVAFDSVHIDLFGVRPMKSKKVNSWLSLGANLGVVLGLVLLIIEIGQNTEMMRAQINQMRADSAVSHQHSIYNSDYIPSIIDKVRSEEELSVQDVIRYRTYFRAFNRAQDNNLWQYNQGYLGENIPMSIRGGVRFVVGGSEFTIGVWDSQKHGYTDEYVAFVEEAIADLR